MSSGTTPRAAPPLRVAMVGNPNVGKTSLFNRLCGVRAKTANFPGSTVEARVGTCAADGAELQLVDLPGLHVARRHAHAVRVVPAQVGQHQIGRHLARPIGGGAGVHKQASDGGFQVGGRNQVAHRVGVVGG